MLEEDNDEIVEKFSTRRVTKRTSLLKNFFSRQSSRAELASDSHESNKGSTDCWMGFEKFSLFQHSSVEEETAGGKNKQTKRTPWLVRILSISWLVFFMMGLCPLKTACAQSSEEEKNEKTENINTWEKSEVNQKEKQPTNLTVRDNRKH